MRLRRFRIRTLMIAVALAALPLGGWREYERTRPWRKHCQVQANLNLYFAWQAATFASNITVPRVPNTFTKHDVEALEQLTRLRREQQDCMERRRKWLVGVWCPWIAIAPDP